jgi:2-oxoisovalerate dehydrogenase E1 component
MSYVCVANESIMPNQKLLLHAYRLMFAAKTMDDVYEKNRQVCKYVHSTSRGHEAIQIATGLQLLSCDFVSPYYRDDSLMLAMGFSPYELILQLLAKSDDPFTHGRSYYCHPNSNRKDKPVIPHQSSATGMQAIPATGMAQGIQYLEYIHSEHLRKGTNGELPLVVCSLGDGSVTEGEVSEAFQFAALHKLPIIYLVQDNGWSISVTAEESRAMNANEFISGFTNIHRLQVDGSNFEASYQTMSEAISFVRQGRKPVLVHARVPLLGHHTSGVRKEWYRSPEDLARHAKQDPLPKLRNKLLGTGTNEDTIQAMEREIAKQTALDFLQASSAPEPDPIKISTHIFAPTPITLEKGERNPARSEKVMMVDAALHAIEEILQEYPEAIFFGQDVGKRLGGVFREAATLGEKFGDHRVFNTAIQEAYLVGSTVGLSALGVKPIVEVQFADYIYPGLNQLVSEVSKSCYLSGGKFPVQMVLRVPTGAYGGGGPYHSGCIESTLLSIKGIKVAYPSNAADMKGLMKAAFLDPNPVIMLEHKGLYWSKVPGTSDARTVEPGKDYVLPFGKGNIILKAEEQQVKSGNSLCIITYGMGVYWARNAAKHFSSNVEIIDLRTLYPLDEDLIFSTVKKHGKCLLITEEQITHSFIQSLAAQIMQECFAYLDAPVQTIGAMDLPAVPMNMGLETAMLPSEEMVKKAIEKLLAE